MAKHYASFLDNPATYASPSRVTGFLAPGKREGYVKQARENPEGFINEHGLETAEAYGADVPGLTPILAINKSLDEQRQRVRRQSRTILTGGQGLMEPAPTAKRVLLG